MQGEACTTAATQTAFLQLNGERIAILGEQLFKGCIIGFDAGEGCRELRGLEMRDDFVTVLGIASAGGEKRFKGAFRLARVVAALILKGGTLVAAAQAADVTDFFSLEAVFHLVMQFLLSAGAKAGGAVAEKDLFVSILGLQEVVGGDGSHGQGIAKERLPAQVMHISRNFCSALGIGGGDHALEEIFFDTLAEGEMAEILGHGLEIERCGLDLSVLGPIHASTKCTPCLKVFRWLWWCSPVLSAGLGDPARR